MILRAKVLENLHSAHQCISSMSARAQVTFFWPGLSNEIERLRETQEEEMARLVAENRTQVCI